MALPNGAGGYQVGAGNLSETIMGAFAVPQTAGSTAPLTAAQIIGGMLVANPTTTAASYILPTAVSINNALPNANIGSTFDLNIINIGTGLGVVTLVMSAGVTDGGNAIVSIPTTSSAAFRFRKSSDTTWVVYKIA